LVLVAGSEGYFVKQAGALVPGAAELMAAKPWSSSARPMVEWAYGLVPKLVLLRRPRVMLVTELVTGCET